MQRPSQNHELKSKTGQEELEFGGGGVPEGGAV